MVGDPKLTCASVCASVCAWIVFMDATFLAKQQPCRDGYTAHRKAPGQPGMILGFSLN